MSIELETLLRNVVVLLSLPAPKSRLDSKVAGDCNRTLKDGNGR